MFVNASIVQDKISVQHIPSKRMFDILFSLCVLIGGFPFFLTIALLVKLTSQGPIFYFSKRIGRGGKMIHCIKFRTMYIDAEERLHKLLKEKKELREEWEKYQKLKKDPRTTKIGEFLRKSSLDEIPQFINVLKGDLSVVGPRPFVLIGPRELFHREIRKYLGDKAPKILSMRPGITGLWQTSGRSDLSIEERVQLEEQYIDHHSFLKDLVLIIKTIPVILFSKGAY